jgi:DNA-binding NarL/FixJ family response regulator
MNVLIADDNPTFRSTLKRVLDSKPYVDEVWEAQDGEEAVRIAREIRPDVVLMDLAMPKIDGLEATRLIKDRQPFILVIVFSAHDEPIYHKAASACGADRFIPKSECIVQLESPGMLQRSESPSGLRGVKPRWIDPEGDA